MSQFKVGNTVRFIDADDKGAHGTRKNALYVVDCVDGNMIGIGLGRFNEVFESRLELVADGVLPFTTGSKVKITNPGNRYDGYTDAAEAMGLTDWASCYHDSKYRYQAPQIGEVGTVLSAFKASSSRAIYAVEMEDGVQHIMGEAGITAYVAPVVPTFNEGDKVRVKPSVERPKYGWGDVDPGDVGVVRRVGPDGWCADGMLQVDFPKQYGWTALAVDMELYTLTPLDEAQAEIARLKKVLDKKDKELLEVRTIIGQAAEILSEI